MSVCLCDCCTHTADPSDAGYDHTYDNELRDEFAKISLKEILKLNVPSGRTDADKIIGVTAYMIADAMMRAREDKF